MLFCDAFRKFKQNMSGKCLREISYAFPSSKTLTVLALEKEGSRKLYRFLKGLLK